MRVLKETGAFRDGAWSQIRPQPAWPGNWSSGDFIAYAWVGENGSRYAVAINNAGNQGQCRLPPPFPGLHSKRTRLTDVMGTEVYDRDGGEIVHDHAPWHYNVFELRVIDE